MEETHEQHKLHGFMQCAIYVTVALEAAVFVYKDAPFSYLLRVINIMRYIKATWVHNFEDEPVLYYQEIDNENFEVRKIVIYKDGHSERASEQFSIETTYLSSEPLPNIDEINSDPQFAAKEITKHEFEMKWNDLE